MRLVLLALLTLSASPARADCAPETDALGAGIARAWEARETISSPAVADEAAALCIRGALNTALDEVAGPPAGWKVGLTSEAAQEQFGVTEPVVGQLHSAMLLEEGETIPRDFGGRPLVEADAIVVVKDSAVMEATTVAEVLASLESFVPFIELADLMVAPGEKLDADIITAINVGARSGVTGTPIPIDDPAAWEIALASMIVRLQDAEGALIGEFPGAAILGNPINAVLYLTDHLAAIGETLVPGDRISLGGFGPPMPVGDLAGVKVSYIGLPGGTVPTATVSFEPAE